MRNSKRFPRQVIGLTKRSCMTAGIPVSEFDGNDASRTTYDLSGSYAIGKLKITVQVRNFTNTPERG